MRKLLFGFLLAAMLVGTASADGGNLLQNGGFENVGTSGVPDGWYTVSYRDMASNTLFSVTDEEAHSGAYSAKIVNANLNDARFVTVVNVEPESMYRVSGYVLVKEMDDVGNGANFALEQIYAVSESVFDSGGEWQFVEWYGETDTDQTQIELGVRVGGFGAESKGVAYFDDIVVEKVEALPTDVYADIWFNIETDNKTNAAAVPAGGTGKSTGWFVLLGFAFLGLTALGVQGTSHPRLRQASARNVTVLFGVGMAGALLLRFLLGAFVKGYDVDISCFSAWSLRMASVGPAGFYAPDYFCDYPPGYMLMLWPVGGILSAFGNFSSPGALLLIKLIPILADMGIALLIFQYARKRTDVRIAALLGLFFAWNPAALVTGAAWGQVDSLLALLLVLAAVTAAEKNWRAALPVFAASVLIKPQALLFAPVGLAWLAAVLAFDSGAGRAAQLRKLWQGALLSLGVMAIVILPFQFQQADILWLIQRYKDTLASYNYAVLNTANLMYLLGGNWAALQTGSGRAIATLSAWVPILTGAGLLIPALWKLQIVQGFQPMLTRLRELLQTLKKKETSAADGRMAALEVLSALAGAAFLLSALFPASYLVYGTMWMVFTYAAVIVLIVIERRAQALPFYMALMMIGVYVLGLKIHERYMFAVCALLPAAYVLTKDRRLIWLCAGISVTTFINTAIVLDNSILFGASMGHLNADTAFINALLCLANLLLCGYAAFIAYTGLRQSQPVREFAFQQRLSDEPHRRRLLHQQDARLHLNLRDALIMGVTFAVYCVVAFTNLGSAKAPQTAWVSASAEDQVVFELPEKATFKLLYYAGVSYHNFSVSVSDDGNTWSDSTLCRMREGLCYRWLYATRALVEDINSDQFAADGASNVVWFTGKYLRINASFAGLNLWEIMLRDEQGERIPVSLVAYNSPENALQNDTTPAALIDEQDTLTGEPGWFNGTYFDEIYYARTAYEHLHGLAPYETSHPPLGKELMAVGIAVFGMTPFGWRFMGTLLGALMLPALYLFGKQLTQNRRLAGFAMILLALDLMHFAQTRLATIDSYPVFFIILSYLCMTRYVLLDPFAVSEQADGKSHLFSRPFVSSLVTLLLCGLFMGFSIAAKWTGLYSAVGLAVLFLYALYRNVRAGLISRKLQPNQLKRSQAVRVQEARDWMLPRILVTGVFCLLFFIVIPAAIYYLSYIPYLSPTGAVTFQRILRVQQSMLAYHSTPGLGMDHPFYSPWWQWPLILKPMWYALNSYAQAGFGENIICMGNPAVFYTGAAAMTAVFVLLGRKYLGRRHDELKTEDQPAFAILAISFLTQYLPWVLVPRSMFIYHYFASLPFIILATMLTASLIRSEKLQKALMLGLLLAALGLFIMFYPYASGMTVTRSYMNFLRWFPNLPV